MDTEHAQDLANYGIQQFRIERGAQVLGPDGALGAVEQIVVDRDTGTVQSLVVRNEAGKIFELPADRIERASGDEVHLSIGRADLASQPELARPYTPEQYVPVDQGAIVPPSQVAWMEPDAPVLTDMEPDAVEIAAPTSPHAQIEAIEALAAEMGVLDDAGDREIEEQDTISLRSSPATPERPLAPHGEMAKSGSRGVLGLAMTGALVGAAVGGLAYLMLRRQQAAPMGLTAARTRLDDLRTAAASTWDAARANAGDRLPAIGAQARKAGSRAQDWLPLAGLALGAWWERGRGRLSTSGIRWRAQASRAADAAAGVVPSRGAVREVVAASTAGLSERSRRLAQQLADAGGSVQEQLQRRVPRRRALDATKEAGAIPAVNTRAAQTRRAAALRARRLRRRMRWFRRGILAGAVWGLLYAPAPGRESRAWIAGTLRRIPGLGDLMGQGAAPSSPVGGTGPHPRSPDLMESATRGATGMRTAPPELTSEEPPLPPPMPEALLDDAPGAASL